MAIMDMTVTPRIAGVYTDQPFGACVAHSLGGLLQRQVRDEHEQEGLPLGFGEREEFSAHAAPKLPFRRDIVCRRLARIRDACPVDRPLSLHSPPAKGSGARVPQYAA